MSSEDCGVKIALGKRDSLVSGACRAQACLWLDACPMPMTLCSRHVVYLSWFGAACIPMHACRHGDMDRRHPVDDSL